MSSWFCLVSVLLTGCSKTHTYRTAPWRETGVLRIGVIDEPDSLNPLFSHTAIADDVAALILAPLFRYDQAGEYIPELAQRVPNLANGDISPDGKKVRLSLRPGLKWADGAPLDTRDLRFTWQAVMNPKNATKLRSGWSNIRTIDVLDAQHVVLHLIRPDATVIGLFAGGGDGAYPPLPAHLLARFPDLNHVAWNAMPISSGPWKLQAWEHTTALRFIPNEHYWQGPPKLHGILLKILADPQTLVTSLKTHEVDILPSVPLEELDELRGLPGLHFAHHHVAAYRHLDFQCQDAILADVRIRRSIVEAIDWSQIFHAIYHDQGVRARSDIPPSSWAAPRIGLYPFNPQHANATLDQAGWRLASDGTRYRMGKALVLSLSTVTGTTSSQRVGVLMQNSLARVGIRLQLKNLAASYLFAEDGPLYTGKYQLAWMSDTRAPDPDNSASWASDAIPPHGANTVYLKDSIVDATAHAARMLFDHPRRAALYQQEETRLHLLTPSFTFAWQEEITASWGIPAGFQPATYYSSYWNSAQWR